MSVEDGSVLISSGTSDKSGSITMGSGASPSGTAGKVVISTGSGETSGSLTLSSGASVLARWRAFRGEAYSDGKVPQPWGGHGWAWVTLVQVFGVMQHHARCDMPRDLFRSRERGEELRGRSGSLFSSAI